MIATPRRLTLRPLFDVNAEIHDMTQSEDRTVTAMSFKLRQFFKRGDRTGDILPRQPAAGAGDSAVATDKKLTLVSFYTTGGYYEEKAEELRGQCDRYGIAHDIAAIELTPEDNWASICRRKVRFYHQMLNKHQSPIMWVDVDSTLLRNFNALAAGEFDIALFPRNFKFPPQFNMSVLSRSFHPGYLLFKYTPASIRFLDDCMQIDSAYDGEFTDDFILEEAFRTTEAMPRLLLLSPRDILRPGEGEREGPLFRHGDSGNVNEFRGQVRQHGPRALDLEAQRVVIYEVIKNTAKNGNRDLAIHLLRYLVSMNPQDFQSYTKLLDILSRSNDAAALRAEIKRGTLIPQLAPFALRQRLVQALAGSDWKLADRTFKDIVATGNTRIIDFARSRMFRHDLDRRAQARAIPDEARVKLFWWEEPYPGNLGDIINPYVVEKMTGVPPKFAPRGEGMCAIGSVIKFAKKDTLVWGSGSPHLNDTLAPNAEYRAVRGPHTRALVMSNGATCPEVYGDPAWFLPVLYAPRVTKTHKTGLILHFTHENAGLDIDPAVRQIGIRRLGYDEIETFLDEMLSCERIVSSSLHGVIIAHAYGIPACLATVRDSQQQIHGDGIKFTDYFASVGVDTAPEALDLSQFARISDDTFTEAHFTPIGHGIDLKALAEAAPFEVDPEVLERIRLRCT